MSTPPDRALVMASAARLTAASAAVRDRAERLSRATSQCRWDGPAARSFRREATVALDRLASAARQLDAAARLLRGLR